MVGGDEDSPVHGMSWTNEGGQQKDGNANGSTCIGNTPV